MVPILICISTTGCAELSASCLQRISLQRVSPIKESFGGGVQPGKLRGGKIMCRGFSEVTTRSGDTDFMCLLRTGTRQLGSFALQSPRYRVSFSQHCLLTRASDPQVCCAPSFWTHKSRRCSIIVYLNYIN